MKKDQSNQELNFKKRARRRLVGAIALVLLMIIFLPMVLEDREMDEQQENIAITMENEVPFSELDTSGFDSSIMPEDALGTEIVEMTGNDTVAIELPNKVEPKSKPSPKEKIAFKPKVEAKAEEKPKAETKPTGTVDEYYVQVGVYSDAANVKKLQARLKDIGYQSKTEKISTDKGEKIRLKTTAFVGKNEAVIALENIKASGLAGIVVKQK